MAEIRLVLEAMIELVNRVLVVDGSTDGSASDGALDVREVLSRHRFGRAASASQSSIARLEVALAELAPLVDQLPGADVERAAELVNEQLTELPIAPSVVDHDEVGPHLHWTPNTATFDTQVMADLLMALAQELVDDGTSRFGRCGADDCGRLFYDGTRNRSRRFCADPRCASRTHTAEHRARRSTGD